MPGVRPGAKKVTSRWSGAQPTVLFGFFLVAFVFAFSADRGSLSVLIFGLIFGGVKSHFDWLACRDFTDEFNVTHSSCGLGKQVRERQQAGRVHWRIKRTKPCMHNELLLLGESNGHNNLG